MDFNKRVNLNWDENNEVIAYREMMYNVFIGPQLYRERTAY